MSWDKLILSLLPLPVFYLIYYRYFTFKPEYIKHIESFLAGIAFALFIIFSSKYIFKYFDFSNPIFVGFVKAALIEKLGAFLIIILLHKYYPNFSLMESILSSILFGMGFSAVENVSYAANFGFSIILLRILFSVPLHLTTCGVMGYYLGLRKSSDGRISKVLYSLIALFLPILLHGTFDTIIIIGGYISYLASPFLLFMVIMLELLMAKSQTMLPLNVIKAMGLNFDDWLMISRQPKYERWILQSMGTSNIIPEHFFLWRPGLLRFFLVILFMIFAITGLSFRTEIIEMINITLRNEDQIIFLAFSLFYQPYSYPGWCN